VGRRLEAVQDLPDARTVPSHPLVAGLMARAQRTVRRQLAEMPSLLSGWQGVPWVLQPCLRDVWHDHLLFQGDALTGLVDYAAAGIDAVAVDLARMLGSLIEDEEDQWAGALEAYREVRELSPEEEQFARVLDRTGVVAGIVRWMRWLDEPVRAEADVARVARRLEELVRRVERW
jgi:Ser/Thr protein kinase RdoA (MazF antagonist)